MAQRARRNPRVVDVRTDRAPLGDGVGRAERERLVDELGVHAGVVAIGTRVVLDVRRVTDAERGLRGDRQAVVDRELVGEAEADIRDGRFMTVLGRRRPIERNLRRDELVVVGERGVEIVTERASLVIRTIVRIVVPVPADLEVKVTKALRVTDVEVLLLDGHATTAVAATRAIVALVREIERSPVVEVDATKVLGVVTDGDGGLPAAVVIENDATPHVVAQHINSRLNVETAVSTLFGSLGGSLVSGRSRNRSRFIGKHSERSCRNGGDQQRLHLNNSSCVVEKTADSLQ